MSKSRPSAGRRLGIITVDQIISSASNLLISVLAARALGVASFGLFGLVFLGYVVAQGSLRALVNEPLLVHPTEARDRPEDAFGSALLLSAVAAVVVALAGAAVWAWHADLGLALVILAIFLPLLGMQDLGRFLALAVQRPARALVLDVAWLVLLLVVYVVVELFADADLAGFIAIWAGSGAAAGLLVFWQNPGLRFRPSLGWLRETWSFSGRYLVSYAATQGSSLLGSIALVAISGARTLGAVRGALLLVGPFMTFQAAAMAAAVSEVAHVATDDLRAVRRQVSRTVTAMTVVAVLNGAVLLLLPDSVGTAVLGATWEPTKQLLLPAAMHMLLLGTMSGVRAGLLGMRLVRITVRIDVVATVLVMAGMVVGAIVGDALGAWWGIVAAQGIVAVIWWSTFLARPAREPGGPVEGATQADLRQ